MINKHKREKFHDNWRDKSIDVRERGDKKLVGIKQNEKIYQEKKACKKKHPGKALWKYHWQKFHKKVIQKKALRKIL